LHGRRASLWPEGRWLSLTEATNNIFCSSLGECNTDEIIIAINDSPVPSSVWLDKEDLCSPSAPTLLFRFFQTRQATVGELAKEKTTITRMAVKRIVAVIACGTVWSNHSSFAFRWKEEVLLHANIQAFSTLSRKQRRRKQWKVLTRFRASNSTIRRKMPSISR
jgi:hypothetical protein